MRFLNRGVSLSAHIRRLIGFKLNRGLIIADLIKTTYPVELEWCNSNSTVTLENDFKFTCYSGNDVLRALANGAYDYNLNGETIIDKTSIDHWLTISLIFNSNLEKYLPYLNKCLAPITYLVSNKLTIADLAIFEAIYSNYADIEKIGLPVHVQRWYSFINLSLNVTKVLKSLPKDIEFGSDFAKKNELAVKQTNERKQEGKFIDLPGAEMGKVVVRFPPEASGYLHIGHAKAALLNQYYQEAFKGKLIMRFDDTNPAKEKVDFEKVILEDLKLLQIKPDLFTHTSQYFDLMLKYCEQLLNESKAYVDDTEPEQMKNERDQRIESPNRQNSVEKNFNMWREMLIGSESGQKCCVRAKIDMSSPNGCLRDPTIYRCKNEPHPRTGTQYKVYPTYDFACPIVDAIEDVTHTLRTTEYHDRDDQFYWFIEALGLRRPYIWEYSRLNMTNTVLSKRKLTWFVDNGRVDGWDDARMPTVRGILRRGMTVEGLRQFIIAQGSSKSVVFMEWDKIWAFNKKVIDPIAPRYTALEETNRIIVNISGAIAGKIIVPAHPKNSEVGTKIVDVGPKILIDYVDAEQLVEGENATFINWGNIKIKKIHKANDKITSIDAELNLENKDFKKTLKLTWLCDLKPSEYPPTYCVYFDHIISKPILGKEEDFKQYIDHVTRTEVRMLGDPELKKVKHNDIIQLQRRGFFRVECAYAPFDVATGIETPLILYSIPDGHTKETSTAGQPKKTTTKAVESKLTTIAAGKQKTAIVTISSNDPVTILSKCLLERITTLGNRIRDLKSEKASKVEIDAAVTQLITLKAEYKTETGKEWSPDAVAPALQPKAIVPVAEVKQSSNEGDILEKITAQGNKIRDLKSKKAGKAEIDTEVKTLLGFKAEYKSATGKEWKPDAVAPAPEPKAIVPVAEVKQSSNEGDILEKITAQGNKIRDLKSKKAGIAEIDTEVKTLLGFKAEYKSATGKEWKPDAVAPAPQPKAIVPVAEVKQSSNEGDILEKITAQGNKIRDLKSKKAGKAEIDTEVKTLLGLKAEYKSATGKEWKPDAVAPAPQPKVQPIVPVAEVKQSSTEGDILDKITAQGNKIRDLKSKKAGKAEIDTEVKALLLLKADYKSATGKEWKPDAVAPAPQPKVQPIVPVAEVKQSSTEGDILDKITAQGNKIRDLKSKKAGKAEIDTEVKALLLLKADYKTVTGKEWKPESKAPLETTAVPKMDNETKPDKTSLTNKINEQGNVVRTLKSSGGGKADVDSAVKLLLDLKIQYKTLTGTDFPTAGRQPAAPKQQKKEEKKVVPEPKEDGGAVKKQTRLGLEATKENNLPEWYSQVITKGEMIEYYDVSGCYILRHWSYAVWKVIKYWFDEEITKMGVKECYFPLFVSRAALEKEKTHIADFAPEVAWVTKSGESDLAEPIAVRPTSETVMYPAYAKWIQSYRDLPIRLNQWNNVVRWEFKHPQPFLRTREFLWQEGHTAFAGAKEAQEEVLDILELYAKVYTDLLAIPVIKGRKTEKEKFAGGDYTTTVEAYISASGRAIQGATSHHLGQNFSKMFDIIYEDPETQTKQYVYQNSWGITTRTIGVMVMVHADNQGLVLPPNVACIQVIIVPCGITVNMSEVDRQALLNSCKELEKTLINVKVKAEGDYRDNYSPGWKFNHWELKGVPIRVELGPKDLKANQFVAVRRDTGEKITIKRDMATSNIPDLLKAIHTSMYNKADKDMKDHTKITKDWTEFCAFLDAKNIIMAPFCGDTECEEKIKADSARDDTENLEPGAPAMGAKSLCIPFEQPADITANDKCVHSACKNKPKFYTLFGRSY